LTDLSVDMTAGWQMVDLATRFIRTALNTPEFQKSKMGKVNAVLSAWNARLETLIAHYTSGKSSLAVSSPAGVAEEPDGDEGSQNSPDADAAPAAETGSD
jgi:hypothetical protein